MTHAAYDFAALESRLREAGLGQPQVVIDLARVDANLDRVQRDLRGRALRIAVKSLPCPQLIRHLMERAGTRRLMAFDVGMLRQCLDAFPLADFMLGKPMPLRAFEWFCSRRCATLTEDLRRVRWLLDSAARIEQYAGVAARLDVSLRVCLEVDVGLHRGGLDESSGDAALEALDRHRSRLELTGLLGYDAHVAKAPWPWTPTTAMRRVSRRYREWSGRVRQRFDTTGADFVHDGAGSPTFALLDAESPVDEVALGSVLVKPGDFDLPGLRDYLPAAWIATPVLKANERVVLPFLESFAPVVGRGRRGLFVYGGRWMAHPAWPEGMRTSGLFGLSSNQQFMSVPYDAPVDVDSYVFFRPTQSEAVLDQFGALTVVTPAGIERWAAFARDAHG